MGHGQVQDLLSSWVTPGPPRGDPYREGGVYWREKREFT